jgi:SWI/SNF-related matrix-associated actin-dependent regulator 1 of chromatin subfamily A
MGTGKTLMTLETAKRTGYTPDIFGPAFLKGTWLGEAEKWGVPVRYHSYSRLKAVDPTKLGQFWVAEEAHYLKNPMAHRTHDFYSLLKSQKPEYFIGLTGTPVKNRTPDFWTLLGFCSVNPLDTNGIKLTGDFGRYYKFCRYFCEIEVMQFGGKKIEKFLGIKPERIEEFKGLLRGKYIRFKVEDVLKDLPSLTRKYVEFQLKDTPELNEAFDAYMSGRKKDITAKVTSATLKIPQTVEYIQNMLEQGSGPIVVFTDHLEPAAGIHAQIKGSVIVTGKTPADMRQNAVNAFQARQIPVIVATIGSLSIGVTLTAARHVVFNDLSWTPADNQQAEKRIHRIGQNDGCFAHYIFGTDTDKHIYKTLQSKINAISQIVT